MALPETLKTSHDHDQQQNAGSLKKDKNLCPCDNCSGLKRRCDGVAPNTTCSHCEKTGKLCTYSKFMQSKAARGIENAIHCDPSQPKSSAVASKSRRSRTVPRLDLEDGRTTDLTTAQSPACTQATTTYANLATQINIVQVSGAVTEASKTLNGSSPKPNVSSLVHFNAMSSDFVQDLFQNSDFRIAVANVVWYFTSQGQVSSFTGDVNPSDLSTQVAAFAVLSSDVPYDQTDVLLLKLSSDEVPLGFFTHSDDKRPVLQIILSGLVPSRTQLNTIGNLQIK